eukprot:2757603-Alexandrium_andersonii.AAC.1
MPGKSFTGPSRGPWTTRAASPAGPPWSMRRALPGRRGAHAGCPGRSLLVRLGARGGRAERAPPAHR